MASAAAQQQQRHSWTQSANRLETLTDSGSQSSNLSKGERLQNILTAMHLSSGVQPEGKTQQTEIEQPITSASGELFSGPDTEQFTPPTLKQQFSQFGGAQPLDNQTSAKLDEQKPTSPFAQALKNAGGTEEQTENSPVTSSGAEQTRQPAAPTKAELFAEMEKSAVAAQTKALQELRAKFEEAKLAANQATAKIATINPGLRTAEIKLEATPVSLLGVGLIEHAWALAKTASDFLRNNKSLSDHVVEAQRRRNAKRAQIGGNGKTMETKSVAETRDAQEQLNPELTSHMGA